MGTTIFLQWKPLELVKLALSHKIFIEAGIKIIFLPTYSLELDPCELVFNFMKMMVKMLKDNRRLSIQLLIPNLAVLFIDFIALAFSELTVTWFLILVHFHLLQEFKHVTQCNVQWHILSFIK